MYQAKRISVYKVLALLLSVSILLTTAFSGTFAQIITKTPSFINTFLSGLVPSGDLVISKDITHPFGDTYTLPDGLSFDFSVSLGENYAGKTVETSQGNITADENGVLNLSIAANTAVRIYDLDDETVVTVSESTSTGFTAIDGAEKSITIQRGTENRIAYTNNYIPATVNPVNLTVSGTKLLEGRDWQEGDSFTFQLDYKLAGEETWEKAGETSVVYELIEVVDSETQEVRYELKPDFDKFDFTELVQSIVYDTVGEYSFRISEVDGTIGGITYDKVVSYFDVLVGDADMDGFLEIQNVKGYQNATATYDAFTNCYQVDVIVNNTYAPEGTATATINIDKRVDSCSGEEKSAAGYNFELYDESENLVATSGETSAAGETFIELTFEAKDAGETFHYILKETHGGETINGMIYADTKYPISVSVADNLDGTISAYIYSTDDYQTEILAVNVPESKAESEEMLSEPTVSGNDIAATDSNATRADGTEETVTEENDTEQTVSDVEETESENVESETVVLATDSNAVCETESDDAEEQTDGEENTPVVISEEADANTDDKENDSDNEAAKKSTDSNAEMPSKSDRVVLTASAPEAKEVAVIPDGATSSYTVSFVNIYDPDDTSAVFDGIKKLTGRALNAGEFAFELYATGESYAIIEGATPIQTSTHNADGEFDFTGIDYDEVGIYRYVVKEDASGNLAGITYDKSIFRVTVTVTDENGVLKATTKVTDELGTDAELIFENTYKASPVSILFSGTKNLTGKELSADMFKFLLYNADENYNQLGAAIAKTYNDADGSFQFNSIEFAEAGTYHYVVKEDSSAAVVGMTYDDTVYGIEVDVWDDGAGSLKAEFTITEIGGSVVDEILFENSYTKPSVPDEPDDPNEPTDPDDPEEPDEPDKPTDPDEPTTPDKPITPEDPTEPSKPSDPDESEKVTPPETGDDTNVGLCIAVMLCSAFALVILFKTKKKEEQKIKERE